MSNHLHVLIQVDETQAKRWDERDVIERWGKLYPGSLAAAYMQDAPLTPVQKDYVLKCVPKWRERLYSVSWFMRSLNEWIARRANEEDRCSGRFWEGRFKSQALLDEAAVITCMAYVDLNPIRAKLAETPETSDFTSIKQRIEDKLNLRGKRQDPETARVPLLPFADEVAKTTDGMDDVLVVPMYRNDYLELVDWTGREIRQDKKGAIPDHIQPILQRLQVNEQEWIKTVQHFDRRFFLFAGSWRQIQSAAQRLGQHWMKGSRAARAVYQEAVQT